VSRQDDRNQEIEKDSAERGATHVVVRLVWSSNGETQVFSLSGGHLGQSNIELSQMGTSDFLIQRLGEHAVLLSEFGL